MHGEILQEERSKIIKRFRLGIVTTLIATDVLSRGLDYPDVYIYFVDIYNYQL